MRMCWRGSGFQEKFLDVESSWPAEAEPRGLRLFCSIGRLVPAELLKRGFRRIAT